MIILIGMPSYTLGFRRMEYTDRFIPSRLPNAGKPLRAFSHVTSSNRQKLLTPNSHVINFYNHYEPYYEFTNFYFQPIKIDDHTWPTTEHYFQAQKFVGTPYYHHIRKLPHPRDAFQVSREHAASTWVRGDWAVVKNDVMLKALREKFTQHDYLKKKLLETKDKVLVEHTVRDSYWGDGGDGKGLNMLGKLLMQVRDEIRCSDKHKENTTTRSAYLRRSSSFSNGLNCLKGSTTTRNGLDSHRSYCDEVLSVKENRRKNTYDQVSHIGTPLTNRKVFKVQPERQERKRSSSSTYIGQNFGTWSKTSTSITNDLERKCRASRYSLGIGGDLEGRLGTGGSDLESRSRPGRANQSSVTYNIISGQ